MADLSTAGIKLYYAVESTAGTKPSTGFVEIAGIKSIPTIGAEPSLLETTTLNATEWRTYVAGLRDTGGAIPLQFNDNNTFQTAWETFKSAYDTAIATGKATWLEVVIPNKSKAFFLTVDVTELGFGGAEVDSVLETTGYVVPTFIEGWETKITA